jgi:hypothetical protein
MADSAGRETIIMSTPSRRPPSREAIAMLEAIGECLTVPWPADWGADREKRLELIESRVNRLLGALNGLEYGFSSAYSITATARGITEAEPVKYEAETPEQAAEHEQHVQRLLAEWRARS